MDYQSFQPNPPAPQISQEISLAQKTFTPKFIGVIVGLLVLGGVAYGAVWFWNDKNMEAVAPTFTPRVIDETVSWQTYRNEKYGFEFRYPVNLNLIDSGNRISIENQHNSVGHVNIISGKVDEEIQKTKKEISSVQGAKLISEKIMSINSHDFSQIIADYPESGVNQNIYNFVQVRELVYEISFFPFEKDFPYDKILSTFKFIEPVVCIQVIASARNPQTGETRDFPTPCDVPDGWIKI